METLSKIGLAVWGMFVVFVVSVLFVSKMPMYWLWLVLGVAICALLLRGLRARHRLFLVNAGAAAAFLATFVLYWIAISATLYGETQADAVVGNRLENVLYAIAGNFQQGHIWRALQNAYIQLVMPMTQLVVLIAALVLAKQSRAQRHQS